MTLPRIKEFHTSCPSAHSEVQIEPLFPTREGKEVIDRTMARPKLGVFMSHPTQHHAGMFRHLVRRSDVNIQVYYYDPGASRKIGDRDFGTAEPWDVDLLSGTNSTILWNVLRGHYITPFRQLNPAIPQIIFRERFDAVLLFGYVSPSNWLVLAAAKLTGAKVFYQSDTNILDEQRKRPALIREFMHNAFLRNVDTFLVIGDKNREAYLKRGINPDQMEWCPIPVDRNRFNALLSDPGLDGTLKKLRASYNIPADAFVVGFCRKVDCTKASPRRNRRG